MKNEILILDGNPTENAKMLDDVALSKMISACAKALCLANYDHRLYIEGNYSISDLEKIIPMPYERKKRYDNGKSTEIPFKWAKFSDWARACLANYRCLLEYTLACCDEYIYRYNCPCAYTESPEDYDDLDHENHNPKGIKAHKLQDVIEWCEQNIPALPDLNQCDGCKSGAPKNESGNHVIPYPSGAMGCTEDLYVSPMPITIPVKFWVVEDPFPVCDLILSHQKYYAHLLKKAKYKIEKRIGIGDMPYSIQRPIKPTWSRREIPSFLGDL
jgi:hypothetical protein